MRWVIDAQDEESSYARHVLSPIRPEGRPPRLKNELRFCFLSPPTPNHPIPAPTVRSPLALFPGTFSRPIIFGGQSFPQLLGGELEELPETEIGQLQPQQLVWRLTLTVAEAETMQVPVQPFQVQ